MKKTTLFFFVCIALGTMSFSCERDCNEDVSKSATIERTVLTGETTIVELGGNSENQFSIITAPTYAVSNRLDGQTYHYTAPSTPAEDVIVLTSFENASGGKQNCCGYDDDDDDDDDKVQSTVIIKMHVVEQPKIVLERTTR
jgi:hypothetical protein